MTIKSTLPNERGRFGEYGGRFVPETLMAALGELEEAYRTVENDASFQEELLSLLGEYVGRPTPLYHAANLSRRLGGAQVYLKREDLAHTGAHKINNAIGQGLLAKRIGKRRIIAETGAGQHGVAAATVCAMLGLECVVYMGEEDIRRQTPNVYRMELLGADVRPVSSGTKTLKDAINETIRDWVTNVSTSHYLLGSAVGPSSLSHDCARLSIGYRQRVPEADNASDGPAAGLRGGLRRWRQQRHRPVPSLLG